MSELLTGLEAEDYIKKKIQRGVASRDILTTLLRQFNPEIISPLTYQEISQLEEFQALGLSDEFISTWLFYPSGREIPSQIFGQEAQASYLVPILTHDDEGYFIETSYGTIVSMPCFSSVDRPFYVPLTSIDVLNEESAVHEYDPDSYALYLTMNTLFAPDDDMAIYYIMSHNSEAKQNLLVGYPGIFTPDVLEALETRSRITCPPTQDLLIPPELTALMLRAISRGYDLIVSGDKFITHSFHDRWYRRPDVFKLTLSKGVFPKLKNNVERFLWTSGYSTLQEYLEHQIELGVRPRQAWLNMLIESRINSRVDSLFVTGESQVVPLSADLDISPEFMHKWYTYPSGRGFGLFEYISDYKTVDLSSVRYLIPMTDVLTRPGFLVDSDKVTPDGGPVITPLTCTVFDNEPLYIPVLRYSFLSATTYEDRYCGTYYYFDDGPGLYLKSNKTLIVPNFTHAYFQLNGGDLNAAQLVRQYQNIDNNQVFKEPLEERARNPVTSADRVLEQKLRHQVDHCEVSDYIQGSYEEGGPFEQLLCRLARRQGYDVIIAMNTFERRHNVSEIIDVRPRPEAFSHLYWAE